MNDKPGPGPRRWNITLEKMVVGLLAALGFYCLGTVGHSLVKPIPIYGWMILLVMVVKCLGWMPAEVEDAACQWGQFVIKAWTAAALFGIGVTLIDLNTIAQNMTLFLTILVVETVIVLTASLIGWKAAHFYPVEAAIAAEMCTTNMGGSGNVAVLSERPPHGADALCTDRDPKLRRIDSDPGRRADPVCGLRSRGGCRRNGKFFQLA